MLVTLKGNLKE